jgi:hypothetical protein
LKTAWDVVSVRSDCDVEINKIPKEAMRFRLANQTIVIYMVMTLDQAWAAHLRLSSLDNCLVVQNLAR